MSLLEARHVTMEYDHRTIIQDICIHLEEGELISLLGLSGSGKTTLFHVLSGLALPKEGQVLLNGRDITGKPGSVSYMLQKDLLLPHKKVIDNVSLPLILNGMSRADARKKADPLFAEFGLEGCQEQYPSSLSGGMRQRAAFLRTYLCAIVQTEGTSASESSALKRTSRSGARQEADGQDRVMRTAALLDEPFSALDTITKDQIHTWYLDVMQKIDLSTIFITHDIDEAILLGNRIYVMSRRPGTVRKEIRVDLSGERNHNMLVDPHFLEIKKEIMDMLWQESQDAAMDR